MTSLSTIAVRLAVPLVAAAALLGATVPSVAAADAPDFPPGYTGYHTYDELNADMQSVASTYGKTGTYKIARMFSIGDSFEGRPIEGMKISDHPFRDENEPEVLVECNMHAREHLTAEQCLYIIHLLTDNYGQPTALGQRVTKIVNTREIWIIPMLNPDGAMFDISGGTFHGWRKNRQTNPGSTKIGIDLNRNWSYMWGCCKGSGRKPKSNKYRGAYPFEAVEDQDLRDFILSRRVNGVQQITRRSTSTATASMCFTRTRTRRRRRSAGYDPGRPRRAAALAKAMASRNGYQAMQGSSMYIYDGDFIDWAYGDQHIFPFTWEMYPKWGCACGGFKPPIRSSRRRRAATLMLRCISSSRRRARTPRPDSAAKYCS